MIVRESVMLARSGGTGRLRFCCFHLSNFAFSSVFDVPLAALTGNAWLIILQLSKRVILYRVAMSPLLPQSFLLVSRYDFFVPSSRCFNLLILLSVFF